MYVRNKKKLRICVYRVADLEMVYLGKNVGTAARKLTPGHVFATADNIGRCLIEAKWSAIRTRQAYLKSGWLGPGYPTPPLPSVRQNSILLHQPGRNGHLVYPRQKRPGV